LHIERFIQTLQYAKYISNIQFNSINFRASNPIYYQKEKEIGRTINLVKRSLLLNGNKKSRIPAIDIYQFRPYDYNHRNKSVVSIHIIYIGDINESEFKIFKSYNFNLEMREMLHFQEIIFKDVNSRNHLLEEEELKNFIKYNKPDCFLLLYGHTKVKHIENAKIIKNLIHEKEIACQGINLKNFLMKKDKNELNYFRNILLGIYGKMGLIPWVLEKVRNEFEIYMGIVIKSINTTNDNYKIISLTIYDNIGVLNRIYYYKCKEDDFNKEITKLLDEILRSDIFKNEIKLNCLFLGNLYEKDMEIFINSFEKHNILNYSVYEIHQNSLVRLYEESHLKIKPDRIGMCLLNTNLEEKTAYFVSSRSFSGTSQPIKIILKNASADVEFENEIQNLFDLTQSYIGYTNVRIKLPIPVYAAQQTIKELIKIPEIHKFEIDKPFFI